MNINLELYKIFLIVAEQKNITKAAKKLMISQPGVSNLSLGFLQQKYLNNTNFISNCNGISKYIVNYLVFYIQNENISMFFFLLYKLIIY